MRSLIAVIAIVSWAGNSSAYFDSGNELLALCSPNGNRFMCLGTIIGHYDMMLAMGYKCPNEANVTKGQVRDIVVQHIQNNPKDRHVPAAYLTALALEGFGCRRSLQ